MKNKELINNLIQKQIAVIDAEKELLHQIDKYFEENECEISVTKYPDYNYFRIHSRDKKILKIKEGFYKEFNLKEKYLKSGVTEMDGKSKRFFVLEVAP